MADKEIISLDEFLKRERDNEKNRRNQKLEKKLNKKKVNKKKRKGIIVSSVALLLAATTGLTTFFMTKNNKKNKPEYEPPKNTITNNIDNDEITPGSLEDLGLELEFPKDEKKEYANPSGNIDTSKIVEDKKGTTWVSPEAESKKDDVGKKELDTQGGTVEKKPDGDVYEKEPSYEIVDKDGSVKEEGKLDNNDLPSEFEKDEDTGKILDDKHSNTGLYVAPDGSLWSSEKEYLDSLELEEVINTETEIIPMDPVIVEESTSSVTSQPTTQVTESSKPTGATKPSTGTYYDEISGLTFQSKEHYDQWVLQDFEGYGIINGIMVPKTDEMQKADQKVLTK